MIILHDPQCADYGSSMRPEQPARITRSVAHLRHVHPDWNWRVPTIADESALIVAHTPALLRRLQEPRDIDDDTPHFPGIYDHARRSVGAALEAAQLARSG